MISAHNTPLGTVFVHSEGQKIYQISFDFMPIDGKNEAISAWFEAYFSGKNPENPFILCPKGSDFRLKIWSFLREIPYGTVVTYGSIAKKISPKMSAQAVGGAIGHNPIPIMIPCHRVVGEGQKLTGFTGGIEKKICLLKTEGIDVTKYAMPKNKGGIK